MEFGWINLFGAVIVVIILIPNIVFALKNNILENLCENKFMNIIEQIGRYGCITFMWVPLLVCKFGFSNKLLMISYFLLNIVLSIVYVVVFAFYLKKRSLKKAVVLAVLPSCIFLLSGIMLRHWLLVVFAVLFTVGHIFVTIKNN